MEATFKVPLTRILSLDVHPLADRLEIATVYGFQVVVPKGQYAVGEKIVYIPVDSILPKNIEEQLFAPDAKIKLTNSRVRQIRIRKFPSQGMICKPETVITGRAAEALPLLIEETDLSSILGIKKYEPPAVIVNTPKGKKQRKKLPHPDFHTYQGLCNIKWFPNLFKETDYVVVQEKLHGCNARASILPFQENTLWKKIKGFFKLNPKFENVYGSNNVDITNSNSYTGWYGEDIYGKVFNDLDVFSKIRPNEIVYGEIVGPGIQKGYDYGLDKHEFVLFDVKVRQEDGSFRWLSPIELAVYATNRGFTRVPELYRGPYNKELIDGLISGPSIFGEEKVREGIVIKDALNYSIDGNKKALKYINPDYLDNKDNSDFK